MSKPENDQINQLHTVLWSLLEKNELDKIPSWKGNEAYCPNKHLMVLWKYDKNILDKYDQFKKIYWLDNN